MDAARTVLDRAGQGDSGKGILMNETMAEEWEQEISLYGAAAMETDRSSQDQAYQAGVSTGIAKCRRDEQEACEPRLPQAEWFGDPDQEPGKWDAWWIEDSLGFGRLERPCRKVPQYMPPGHWECVAVKVAVFVAPVAREGFPFPVGWGVVGEK